MLLKNNIFKILINYLSLETISRCWRLIRRSYNIIERRMFLSILTREKTHYYDALLWWFWRIYKNRKTYSATSLSVAKALNCDPHIWSAPVLHAITRVKLTLFEIETETHAIFTRSRSAEAAKLETGLDRDECARCSSTTCLPRIILTH